MGLVSLTYTDSGDSFYLDENNIIRVYSQNSETKVQYIDVELGVVKTVTVDETVSVVGGSSNLLIALTETASGSTFYLNSGMISLVTPNASGSLVRFDYNGQQLQIQVNESDVQSIVPTTLVSQVTQITSSTTPVTINSNVGKINLVNTSVGANTGFNFTVNNSKVEIASAVLVSCEIDGFLGALNVHIESKASGSFVVRVFNPTGVSTLGSDIIVYFRVYN